MALTGQQAYALSKKYTDEEIAGGGAIKGKNCTIESIEDITGGHRVTFEWTLDNGTVQTTTMDVMDGNDGADGKGIASVAVNEESHLIITYTDGTTTDAGAIEVHSAVDSVNGKTGVVTLTASDVGALPDNTTIPSKTSDLNNDSNFIADASYVHTDNNYDNTAKGIVNGVTTALAGKISTTEKGVVNGVAELDATGRVPSAQLPSYVDDTIEGYLYDGKWYSDAQHTTEVSGETGKIYVELTTNKTYRWSGSAFVEISESLALGETSSTAYAGNKGKANADAITGIKNGNNINSFGAVESAFANYTPTDSLTSLLSGKADKDTDAVEGNFAAFDASGNPVDSGHKHSDYLTQHQDISGKADKVTTGTPNGKLASLDETGNLANSGVIADMTSATATGNPISFTTDSAQVAQNTVITFEPIQAGSGDPSPSNVREIEGYIEAKLTVPRKNLVNQGDFEQGDIDGGAEVSSSIRIRSQFVVVESGEKYTLATNNNELYISEISYFDASYNYKRYVAGGSSEKTITVPENINALRFTVKKSDNTELTPSVLTSLQMEKGETATTYEPYNPLTDISEQLPTTLYGFKLNVESGELIVTHKRVDMGSLDWTYGTYVSKLIFYANLTGFKAPTASSPSLDVICEKYSDSYTHNSMSNVAYNMTDKSLGGVFGDAKILVYDTTYSDVTTFKAAMSGVYLVYELATPITYHLTPHQVKLLQGSNTVTTNGTSIALTYRKGEVAKLSDLNGIAESVEGLGEELTVLNSKQFELLYSGSVANGGSFTIPTNHHSLYCAIVRGASVTFVKGTRGIIYSCLPNNGDAWIKASVNTGTSPATLNYERGSGWAGDNENIEVYGVN